MKKSVAKQIVKMVKDSGLYFDEIVKLADKDKSSMPPDSVIYDLKEELRELLDSVPDHIHISYGIFDLRVKFDLSNYMSLTAFDILNVTHKNHHNINAESFYNILAGWVKNFGPEDEELINLIQNDPRYVALDDRREKLAEKCLKLQREYRDFDAYESVG